MDEKVPQPTSFLNYEAAINTVIIQVEKYDPKISAKYWRAIFQDFEDDSVSLNDSA